MWNNSPEVRDIIVRLSEIVLLCVVFVGRFQVCVRQLTFSLRSVFSDTELYVERRRSLLTLVL
jgi:hypothetical protein